MAGEIATAFVAIRPKTTSFQAEAGGQISKATAGLAGQLAKTAGVLIGGALLAKGVKDILSIGVAYRDSLNTFQAVTGATTSQMLQVSVVAKQLGNDIHIPGASAADAAVAMTELARAGLSVQDSMNAARGSLQLAAAGEVDAKTAATLMAAALNTFALRGSEAVRVADLLAATANNSAAEITDIAYGLQSAGSAAHAAGFNINETTTALGELSNAGLSGERAGTSFRSLLISLEKPSKKAETALKAMNVSIYDQGGKMRPLVDIIGQFQKGTAKMTDAQRNANFAQIAGTYGLTALNVLVGKGTASYLKMENANLKQGAAADLANAKMKGLGGATRGLQNTLETAAISVYQKFSPSLERGVLSLNDFLSSVLTSKGFGNDMQVAADIATSAVTTFIGALKGGISVLQALSPEIHTVLSAIQSFGAGPILVGIATFKAIGIASNFWSASQARLNALIESANAPMAAAAAETARLAAAEEASALAAAQMAVATNAAAASTQRLSVGGAGSSITGLGAGLRTATTEAETLAPAIAGVGAEAGAAGAAGEVGLLGAATAAIAPIAVVAGVAALAAGIYYLSTQSSAAEKAASAAADATGRLASTSSAYKAAAADQASARQATSDLNLQRQQATLGIAQANDRLAVDKKAHASNLVLAQDAINIKIANEGWRAANTAVLGSQQQETTASQKQVEVSKQHQEALGKLITSLNAGSNAQGKANLNTAVGAREGHAYGATLIDSGLKLKATIKLLDGLSASTAKTQPVLSKAAGFVAEFAKQTGKVPSRAETTFIFNHTKSDSTFAEVQKQLSTFITKKNTASLELNDAPFQGGLEAIITTVPDKGAQIGTGMATGVVTGLSQVDIASIFATKISAAIAAGKHAAGVKSPSTVTRDQLGRPLMQGITLGINIEAPKAVATARTAALKVTDAFVDGLAGFQKKAKSALSFEKLFTSNIQSAIQSARQNLTGLGSTLSASLGTYLDAQNDQAIKKLQNSSESGNPAIKALTDAIATRAHDATVKGAAEAVTAAQQTISQLTAQGGPDAFASTAAQDAIDAARQSLSTLQETASAQKESLTDALLTAQKNLDVAVNGIAGTDVTKGAAGTLGTDGTPLRPGISLGRPFSSGTKIAGTYHPAVAGTAGTLGNLTTSITGAQAPGDDLTQRAAQRGVADAKRALDQFQGDYNRSLNAATRGVHDATLAQEKLQTDYTQQVKDAQKGLTDALSSQLDLQDQDKADALQKALDDATAKQQQETDNAKLQLTQQLDDLTNALELKQITLSQFQQAVLADIGTYAPGWNDAGAALGSAFVDGIQTTIANLLQQGSFIATGPAGVVGGLGVGANTVSPLATQKADALQLRATLLADRTASVDAIKKIATDTAKARDSKSPGKGTITTSEQATIDADKRAAIKAQGDLTVAMRALAKNAGWGGFKIANLTVSDDPTQAVSSFLKDLAQNTNK